MDVNYKKRSKVGEKLLQPTVEIWQHKWKKGGQKQATIWSEDKSATTTSKEIPGWFTLAMFAIFPLDSL